MFNKLKDFFKQLYSRFFAKKTSEPTVEIAFDCYKPVDRVIYAYHDGQNCVRVDPMVVYKKIIPLLDGLKAKWPVAFNSAEKPEDAIQAHTEIVSQIREVFNIPLFDDGGLVDTEVIELFDHFMTYCRSKQIAVSAEKKVDETQSDA